MMIMVGWNLKKKLCLIIATCFLFFPYKALVLLYTEIADAGETLVTAQILPGGVDVVKGSVSEDADLYGFYWGGGEFYANSIGSEFDSQLFLFDSSGHGLWGSDDGISFAGPAYIQDGDLSAGLYYIGISAYDYDPRDASGGLIFENVPYPDLFPANSAAGPLDQWAGTSFEFGLFQISFQQVDPINGTPIGDPNPTAPVPEPTTMLFVGSGLCGLAGFRRWLARKKKYKRLSLS